MGSLGWPEILIILVIALIIFGPRKLPELGKTLGASLAQFRRASEDFKRTWEEEVEMEKRKLDAPPPAAYEYSSASDPYEGQDFSLDGSHAESPGEESGQVDGTSDENAVAYASEEAAADSLDQSTDAATDTTPTPVDGVHAAEDAKRDAV
jgi:sec-independent protein translocase protein TatA